MPRDGPDALSADDILPAYTLGYFPMARTASDRDIVWVLPHERGVLELIRARAPRKLLRRLRRSTLHIRFDTAFVEVMKACAAPAPGREDTWINDQILEAYSELHFRGHAHSVECWRDDRLVGGLYGVALGGVFCGESMFSREADASKIAMLHLIARLRAGGFSLLDAQFHTDHLAQFGVERMPRDAYLARLQSLLTADADFNAAEGYSSDNVSVWQSITQTS
ncbi:MAG: leucyl/phenylalanyl-tRNA--protein transferase [Alphaproteobacteria bacterium]|nr:leucyl/phenylalanyl-tRNA--protein transferase [Alphaproteobacteria bacterium]